jgi:DNA-binding NarL/FixJ family response regulator
VSDRAIQIFLLDADLVFSEGLTKVLNAREDTHIIAQAQTLEQARHQLTTFTSLPDVFVLDIHLTADEETRLGVQFCQELKSNYPNLPLFVLTTVTADSVLRSLRNLGIEGYSRKRTPLDELVHALQQVARGELYWQQSKVNDSQRQLPPASPPQPITPPRWVTRQRETGLAEIERNLARVEAILEKDELSNFDWLFWSGLRRELKTARWIVQQLLPVEVVVVGEEEEPEAIEENSNSEGELPPLLTSLPTSLSETLLQTTLGKIQLGIVNNTGYTLEIDILSPEKKRELLYLVVQEFQEILTQLEFVHLSLEDLPERRSLLLRELWQTCLTRWISKYIELSQFPATAGSIVEFVIREAPLVESMRLNKLPDVTALLAYLLYEEPLKIDQVSYRPESPEAQARAEMLLHNLILVVANAVMQVILNQFGEQETVKNALYANQYRSSREIARFRNELSWQYRQTYYIQEPKAIFESRHELLVLRGNRIQAVSVYAPRKEDLEQLQGIRLGVTIALEFRDAIAPRFRAVFGVVGQAVVYLLTQVIGRGIGLIGRGILQGIGKSVESKRDQQ